MKKGSSTPLTQLWKTHKETLAFLWILPEKGQQLSSCHCIFCGWQHWVSIFGFLSLSLAIWTILFPGNPSYWRPVVQGEPTLRSGPVEALLFAAWSQALCSDHVLIDEPVKFHPPGSTQEARPSAGATPKEQPLWRELQANQPREWLLRQGSQPPSHIRNFTICFVGICG